MAAIDLIVLGMIKAQPQSAYELQKNVEYRNISKWVKVSTPSIYKKVVQLEEKGYIRGKTVKEGKMPEKAVYSLTEKGEQQFEKLMDELSCKPVHIFLDFNAVIVNLENIPLESRKKCLKNIDNSVKQLKIYLENNINQKENDTDIPVTGRAVIQQQYVLAQAIEEWLESVKKTLE